MEEILEQMVHFICQYRHWNVAKVSKLPPNVIENEYAKAKDDLELSQSQEMSALEKRKDSDDEFYREPEIVNRKDLMAMYPAGVSKKDAMGYVYDDFLGPSEPNNGKGRR